MTWRFALEMRWTLVSSGFLRTYTLAYTYLCTNLTHRRKRVLVPDWKTGNSRWYHGLGRTLDLTESRDKGPFTIAFQNGPDMTPTRKKYFYFLREGLEHGAIPRIYWCWWLFWVGNFKSSNWYTVMLYLTLYSCIWVTRPIAGHRRSTVIVFQESGLLTVL